MPDSPPDGGLDTLIERLAAAGIEIVTPLSEAPGGFSADYRDLDGQVISLFQGGVPPGRIVTAADDSGDDNRGRQNTAMGFDSPPLPMDAALELFPSFRGA